MKNRRKVIDFKKVGSFILSSALVGFLLTGCGYNSTIKDATKQKTSGILSSDHVQMDKDGIIWHKKPDGSIQAVAHVSETEKYPIKNNATFMNVVLCLDELSDIERTLQEYGAKTLINEYVLARQEENLEKMNLYFSKLSLITLKAQVLDAMNISVDKVQNITLYFDPFGPYDEFTATIEYKPAKTIVPGGIEVLEKNSKVETIRVGGVAADILSDVVMGQKNEITTTDLMDLKYLKLINFICASAEYKEELLIFSDDVFKRAEVHYSK